MRYRVAVTMLLLPFAVLPLMDLLAAPAPEPWGILDIGPPIAKTAGQHLKDEIGFKTDRYHLNTVCSNPEVKMLPSVASKKDASAWLAQNLRVTPDKGGRLLRFSFRAGTIKEKAAIINAFLRASLHWHDIGGIRLKCDEEAIRHFEQNILHLERCIESGKHPEKVDLYREKINRLRHTQIRPLRAEITLLKQYTVIRWAR